ncbi:MAG: crossover junction endodeoxyribonuclease RuvC [Syntrophales bacterium]
MKILGVDPGSHVTGFGVVEKSRSGLAYIRYGEIRIKRGMTFSECLNLVYNGLMSAIVDTAPDFIAIEDIFYGKNARSLIRQGHVRGVAILTGSHNHIPVVEYTPMEVKKAVVGYGRADKGQVQKMVQAILKLPELPPEDAADALAVAICHAHAMKGVTV